MALNTIIDFWSKSNLVEATFYLIKNTTACYGKKQIETYLTQYCREFQFFLRRYGFNQAYLLSHIKQEIKNTVKGIYAQQHWEVNDYRGLPTNPYVGRPYSLHSPNTNLLLSDESSGEFTNSWDTITSVKQLSNMFKRGSALVGSKTGYIVINLVQWKRRWRILFNQTRSNIGIYIDWCYYWSQWNCIKSTSQCK